MIEQHIRPRYQAWLVDPLAKRLSCHPNLVTLLACLLGITVPLALWCHNSLAALALLLASGFCDTLDGTLARRQQRSSALGTLYDILADRAVEFAVIFGLVIQQPAIRAMDGIIMLGTVLLCVTSFLLVGMFSDNQTEKSFYYSPGIVERPEAFTLFGLMIIFPAAFSWLATIFSALVLLTTVIRVWEFRRAMLAG